MGRMPPTAPPDGTAKCKVFQKAPASTSKTCDTCAVDVTCDKALFRPAIPARSAQLDNSFILGNFAPSLSVSLRLVYVFYAINVFCW